MIEDCTLILNDIPEMALSLEKNISWHCPKEGSFYAYKKVIMETLFKVQPAILKLYIPKEAIRVSPIVKITQPFNSYILLKNCRCSKAKVVEAFYPDGKKIKIPSLFVKFHSSYDFGFLYKVGKEVTSYCDIMRNRECSCGIHFFMTFKEAVDYHLL